mgnify:CR=1 FL=1
MRINRPQYPYLVHKNIGIFELLKTLQLNKTVPVVVVNKDLTIYGILSKGDFIDFIAVNPNINISKLKVQEITNKLPIIGHVDDNLETIKRYLEPANIQSLPIIDHNRKVIKIITKEPPSIKIERKIITENSPPYLIAEIGVNHNGDLKEALFLIENAGRSGCDAVKFQYRSEFTYSKNDLNSFDLGTQYILSELKRTKLSIEEISKCCDFANSLDMDFIVTPFDEIALNQIIDKEISLSAIKIASCDLTNLSLIKHCSQCKLPLIISTGMSYEREIINTSRFLNEMMIEHAFLHCNSTYPSPVEDTNLKYIERLRDLTKTIVGFSSHEGNINIPLNSISYGAKIIEFHITRSIESLGTDHRASIEVKDLDKLVKQSRIIFEASGRSQPREPSQGELSNRLSLGKSLALNKNLKKGNKIKKEDIILISPGSGLGPDLIDNIVGNILLKDYESHTLLQRSDFEMNAESFKKEMSNTLVKLEKLGYIVGIPVRYHDVINLNKVFNLKMLEFHMSDRDLSLDSGKFFSNELNNIDLIVHAVEQYEDGFILDLASKDEFVISRSYKELDRLFKHIDKLRKYFRPQDRIPIVLNIGGFTNNGFLNDDEYKYCMDRVVFQLNKVNNLYADFRILPQTMPPFPWHQGGRSYHNLLTKLSRVGDFIERVENNICLDISHTALSCSYFKEDINHHIKTIGSRIFHIHLSDAQGNNAEGLEIGNGTLNFYEIHNEIKKHKQKVFMIPEIWQGHLHQGEKFANSLFRFKDLIS